MMVVIGEDGRKRQMVLIRMIGQYKGEVDNCYAFASSLNMKSMMLYFPP